MRSVLTIISAGLVAAALVVLGLWVWQSAGDIAIEYWGAGRPEMATWSVRSAAVGMIAAAQTIATVFVAGRLFRRGAFDVVVTLSAGLIVALAMVGALACGTAAR